MAQWLRIPSANAGDLGSILRSRRTSGEGNDNPVQYSCLGNPTDRGVWQATVHGVTDDCATEHACTFMLLLDTGQDEQ